MGRVRRYKAIKACDPFSKKKGRLPTDTKHDDPPELWEKKRRKKQQRMSKIEDSLAEADLTDDKVIEKLARKAEQQDQKKENTNTKAAAIEPMRKGETLEAFQNRVRKQTRLALIQEIPKLRKSAIRRKDKMKELKQKKKESKKTHVDPEDEYRPQRAERVSFGERVTEPPRLQELGQQLALAAQKAKAKALLAKNKPQRAIHGMSEFL